MHQIKPGKTGADHRDIDVLRCAMRRFGSTICDHCLGHATSSHELF
jgi:hypothetical protein